MSTVRLRKDQWQKLLGFLQEHPQVYVGKPNECKRFIEAIMWMARSGAQWRLLPKSYGNWNSVYKRFNRWSERGVWEEMFEHFSHDPDMESLMMDSSVIRAHASAAGALHKKGVSKHKPSATVAAASALKSIF